MEESSFQTLEALASHISQRIIIYFLIPHYPADQQEDTKNPLPGWNYQRIRIKLEKPTAVTFADAPVVEMLVDSDPKINKDVGSLWENAGVVRLPPFPLEGKLGDWIANI